MGTGRVSPRSELPPLSLRARLEHTHVIGTTGGGKTKFIEHGIRQDIIDGHGVCVVDPHGNHPDSLYRSLLSWLEYRGLTRRRTIHIIDPNAGTHVTGLNPLALPSSDYDPTVIAEAMQEALERVWGEEDMDSKPTMQRVLGALLTALTELDLTLAEARLLLDPLDRSGVRAWAIGALQEEETREEFQWLHDIAQSGSRGAQDFRAEVTGPRNRLAKLTRASAIRTMLGQQTRTIDFRTALDEGHIILANLSPGPRASDKAVQLLGRLLTRMLFFHSERRLHPERPFFFYLDECQLFLSGDVSRMLAETRKYGLGVVLSHQYLGQFGAASEDILNAVKNTTNVKVVLRIKDPAEAAELAEAVLNYNLEIPVSSLIKETVTGHRRVKLKSESSSDQTAKTVMRTDSAAHSVTRAYGVAETEAETVAEGKSVSDAIGRSSAHGRNNAIGFSSASMSGGGTGSGVTSSFLPNQGLLGPQVLSNISVGESAQAFASQASGASEMNGYSDSEGMSSSASESKSSSVAKTYATMRSESVAYGQVTGTSIGTAGTTGQSKSQGTQEAFEPILELRPSAVHGIENVRYMTAQILRNLPTGMAAVSFVDGEKLQTASLRVANVVSYSLPVGQFEELRKRTLDESPSASRLEDAQAHVEARKQALFRRVASAQAASSETTSGFRVKKTRSASRGHTETDRAPEETSASALSSRRAAPKEKPSHRLHGRQKAAGRSAVKGLQSPEATVNGPPLTAQRPPQ